MQVEQLSIPLHNNTVDVSELADSLAQNCINIRALSFTNDYGNEILQLIVNDTDQAQQLIEEKGYKVKRQDVLVIEVPDKPGGLATVLQTVKSINQPIDFLNTFSQKSGDTGLIILRFADFAMATEALLKSGIRLLTNEELCAR